MCTYMHVCIYTSTSPGVGPGHVFFIDNQVTLMYSSVESHSKQKTARKGQGLFGVEAARKWRFLCKK